MACASICLLPSRFIAKFIGEMKSPYWQIYPTYHYTVPTAFTSVYKFKWKYSITSNFVRCALHTHTHIAAHISLGLHCVWQQLKCLNCDEFLLLYYNILTELSMKASHVYLCGMRVDVCCVRNTYIVHAVCLYTAVRQEMCKLATMCRQRL